MVLNVAEFVVGLISFVIVVNIVDLWGTIRYGGMLYLFTVASYLTLLLVDIFHERRLLLRVIGVRFVRRADS